MQIRITKTRAAMAALLGLAGVGLGSLLSPLVGTALATAGQIVNISDRSGSAFFSPRWTRAGSWPSARGGSLTVDGKVPTPTSPPPQGQRREHAPLPSTPSGKHC